MKSKGTTKQRFKARKKPGVMNELEQWYWDNHIDPLLKSGDYILGRYEAIKLRLADNTWYTPDFYVILKDGSGEFHETKGTFWHDDARAKFKIAADIFDEYTWKWVVIKGGKKARTIEKIEII